MQFMFMFMFYWLPFCHRFVTGCLFHHSFAGTWLCLFVPLCMVNHNVLLEIDMFGVVAFDNCFQHWFYLLVFITCSTFILWEICILFSNVFLNLANSFAFVITLDLYLLNLNCIIEQCAMIKKLTLILSFIWISCNLVSAVQTHGEAKSTVNCWLLVNWVQVNPIKSALI